MKHITRALAAALVATMLALAVGSPTASAQFELEYEPTIVVTDVAYVIVICTFDPVTQEWDCSGGNDPVTTETVIDSVEEALADGEISKGEARSTISHLNNIARMVEKGKTDVAEEMYASLLAKMERRSGDGGIWDELFEQLGDMELGAAD